MKKLSLRLFFAIMAIGTIFPLQAQNWIVAGMNAKVEELTLYIIEMEKRITEMEKKGGER